MSNFGFIVYLCVVLLAIQNVSCQSSPSQLEEEAYVNALSDVSSQELAQRNYDNYKYRRAFLEDSLSSVIKKANELLEDSDISAAQKRLLKVQIDFVEKQKNEGTNDDRQNVLSTFPDFLWSIVRSLGLSNDANNSTTPAPSSIQPTNPPHQTKCCFQLPKPQNKNKNKNKNLRKKVRGFGKRVF